MRSPSPSPSGRRSTRNLRSISTPEGGVSSIRMEHYAPVELLLPDSGEAVLATLRERLALDVGRARSADRILLDSFDGRLREAGLRAEAPLRGATLTLYEPGAPARREKVARAPRYLVQELPRGPLRERLAGVLEERALLPAVRVRGTVRPLAVLNGDAKTVVRLELEDAEAVLERGRRVPLASRLTVEPVLGYDAELTRTLRVLRDRLGFAPAERPLFDEAVLAAGGLPEGISTKPKIDLARGTRTDRAAGVVLRRLLEIAETNLPGTIDDLDTEFLHDLRVSIRRARSVLRELKDVHEPGAAHAPARRAQVGAEPHRPGPRPRRRAARVGGARRPARARAATGARAAARAARAAPRTRVHEAPARVAERTIPQPVRRLASARRRAARGRPAERRAADRGARRRADPQGLPAHGARRRPHRRRLAGRGPP